MRRHQVTHDSTLLAFLLAPLAYQRKAAKSLLKFGAVAVNGRTVRQFDHSLAPGDEVVISSRQSVEAAEKLEHARIHLLYEDEDLLVLDKPAGLLTVATDRNKTDTLYFRLREFLIQRDAKRQPALNVVHRLDQETSGLVLFAKSAQIKAQLQDNWPAVQKTYWAVVEGRPPHNQETITSYLTECRSLRVTSRTYETEGSRLATTHYRVLRSASDFSLLEVRLETGRKHQIRVHLAERCGPVIGDKRYGSRLNPWKRLALHACKLELAHPVTGKPLRFESPMPPALARLFPKT